MQARKFKCVVISISEAKLGHRGHYFKVRFKNSEVAGTFLLLCFYCQTNRIKDETYNPFQRIKKQQKVIDQQSKIRLMYLHKTMLFDL